VTIIPLLSLFVNTFFEKSFIFLKNIFSQNQKISVKTIFLVMLLGMCSKICAISQQKEGTVGFL
jgi:hypothetical protein